VSLEPIIGLRFDGRVSKMEDLVYDNLWDKYTECEQNNKIITTNSDDSRLVNRENGENFNSNDTEMINSTKDNVSFCPFY